ncbi:ornithine cyclodeaminase [Actinopolyspora lacussalsi subsp. righensis]|uniref:Ornithine cyclodeaminase n=1 Tax=Actinopolyspora righensis TaxID=995060 RepID=A0A1I7BB45_9ACTN|nr:2,3-diaminopropionate biosynthesis protein SbnB [Actinopolyspora righensis]SFT84272.1 ornithine cyclodeaminase [Actinopolyspora righensis]
MPELSELPFRVISAEEVLAQVAADRPACVDMVRRGYLAHDDLESVVPHSGFLRFPHRESDRIISLPSYLGGEFDVAGIKWIASFPGNTEQGIPRASAALLLNDCTNGYPFGCLEASIISATRTAASAVLAAETLSGSRETTSIGFIGTGLIADHVRRFFRDLDWEVGDYRLFDLDPTAAEKFAGLLAEDGAEEVEIVDSPEDAFGADVVVLTTVAGRPHLHDPALLEHNPVVLHVSLRDLGPELIRNSFNITDDVAHAVREQTSLHLTEQADGHREFVHGTIGELLNGKIERAEDRATIFSPFGLGALDLAVGKWVHERVTAAAGGTAIPGFFTGAAG